LRNSSAILTAIKMNGGWLAGGMARLFSIPVRRQNTVMIRQFS
jgi:hypothetical protein